MESELKKIPEKNLLIMLESIKLICWTFTGLFAIKQFHKEQIVPLTINSTILYPYKIPTRSWFYASIVYFGLAHSIPSIFMVTSTIPNSFT